jgi:hypothetical protein
VLLSFCLLLVSVLAPVTCQVDVDRSSLALTDQAHPLLRHGHSDHVQHPHMGQLPLESISVA